MFSFGYGGVGCRIFMSLFMLVSVGCADDGPTASGDIADGIDIPDVGADIPAADTEAWGPETRINDIETPDATVEDTAVGDVPHPDVEETGPDAKPDIKPEICVYKTCVEQGIECGIADDGCGGILSCGLCGTGTCTGGLCLGACGGPGCGDLWDGTCSGENGYKVCGLDESGCPKSSVFIACQKGNGCDAGACSGGCTVPELMLVVDRSSSMEGELWAFTRDAIADWVTRYQHGMKLGLRMFPGGDGCGTGDILGLKLDGASGIIAGLTPPAPASSTPLTAAITGLEASFGDPNQAEHIVLISDGTESCAESSDALDAARALRSRGAIVSTIGIGFGYDAELLSAMASQGGGEFRTAQDGSELDAALTAIAAQVTGCAQPGAGVTVCEASKCAIACDPGTHACGDECRSNAAVTSCGLSCVACPKVANANASCTGGTCGFECDSGYHACGGACVSNAALASCGTQCTPCLSDPNGTASCDGSTCGMTCDSSYHACGSTCKADASVNSCGTKCSPCPSDSNGAATCVDGSCGKKCNAGHHFCSGVCVSDASPNTCGSSCAPCPVPDSSVATCSAGVCGIKCAANAHICGGVCVGNTDIDHCGASCDPCPGAANGVPTCNGTSCGIKCDAGFSQSDAGTCFALSTVTSFETSGYRNLQIDVDGSGNPLVAYMDADLDALRVAVPDGEGWAISTADASEPDTGQAGSLSLVVTDAGVAHIAYSDLKKDVLRYAVGKPGSFSAKTLDPEIYTGGDASIALQGSAIHISYRAWSVQELRIASKNGGSWTTGPAGGDDGDDTRLQIDADGHPHIVYCRNYIGLRHRYWDGSAWVTELIGGPEACTSTPDFVIDGDGTLHVAFHHYNEDTDTTTLRYAWRDGDGDGDDWTEETVKTVPYSPPINMAVMPDGRVFVVHSNGGLTLERRAVGGGWTQQVLSTEPKVSYPDLAVHGGTAFIVFRVGYELDLMVAEFPLW